MAGNNYSDYRERRKVTGRLKLENQMHEDVIQLLCEGYTKEQVIEMLGDKITVEEIEELLAMPLGQRRYEHVKNARARAEYVPQTAEECLAFSKGVLIKLAKEAEDKVKIVAAKELAGIAIDEMEAPKKQAAPAASADLDDLKNAFGDEKSGDE